MTVKEVAGRLELSVSLVYAMLKTGKLRGNRHGLRRGTWRISEEQLQEYLCSTAWAGASDVPPAIERVSTADFKNLDASRLLAAWRRRGANAGRRGGRSAPSS